MAKRDIVVIGASAGGIEAVSTVLRELPRDIPASLFLVVHMMPTAPSYLPDILAKRTPLKIEPASDDLEVKHGVVYVAQPDRHLILQNGSLAVVRGPRENLHRPSVDVLFRSAAFTHGSRVIGIVLSGNLDDGSSGLWAIKSRGGVTIAQDPNDAMFPEMPRNAIRYSTVDHIAPAAGMSRLIMDLVQSEGADSVPGLPRMDEIEAEEAPGVNKTSADELGTPSYFTCPSCSGTLWEYRNGGLVRYRCRVGHAFSAESMMAEQSEEVERALWVAIRSLDEKSDLMRRLADSTRRQNAPFALKRLEERRKEAEENAAVLREMVRSLKDVDPPHD